MRLALDLRSECCNDWCVWLLCPLCATCEEARELRFRHVGSTEEFVDKSQEIRVRKWGAGLQVSFKEGERVIHPDRGHGTVILIMPDSRRVVKYDSGTVHYYSPGKTQWKFRLEKVTSKRLVNYLCCCAPYIQSQAIDSGLTNVSGRRMHVGDIVCQNERGTGTVEEVMEEAIRVTFDSCEPEEAKTTVIRAGADPNMTRIKRHSLCPCCLGWYAPPSTKGAVDGHDEDSKDEIEFVTWETNEMLFGHDSEDEEYVSDDDGRPPPSAFTMVPSTV